MGSTRSSMIAWTIPTTAEQIAYYSKHAKKRGVYMMVQTMLQLLHAAIAFGAWYMLAEASIGRYFNSPPLFVGIAVVALGALHPLLKTTWATYWYDQLDDDPNTDSSIWIPIVIVVLLIFTEYKGAQSFLESKIVPPTQINTDSIQQAGMAFRGAIDKEKANEIKDLEATYAAQKAAVKSTAAAAANKVTYKKDGWKKVRTINADRDVKLAAIDSELAAKKTAVNDKYAGRLQAHDDRSTTLIAGADTENANRKQEYTAELSATQGYAWVISLALMALILALGYAVVRINVMSGILPQYHFTELDAHGGALQRIFIALKDALNRQLMRLAVNIHKGLSPSKPLEDFDGQLMILPGNYNSTAHASSPTLSANTTNPAQQQQPSTPGQPAKRDYRPFSLPGTGASGPNISNNAGGGYSAQSGYGADFQKFNNNPPKAAEKAKETTLKWENGKEFETLVLTGNDTYLFKQSDVLFKQVRGGDGVVIGLEYKGPRMDKPTSLSYTGVTSRISTYKKGVQRADETIERNLYIWNFALTLFEVKEDVNDFRQLYSSVQYD